MSGHARIDPPSQQGSRMTHVTRLGRDNKCPARDAGASQSAKFVSVVPRLTRAIWTSCARASHTLHRITIYPGRPSSPRRCRCGQWIQRPDERDGGGFEGDKPKEMQHSPHISSQSRQTIHHGGYVVVISCMPSACKSSREEESEGFTMRADRAASHNNVEHRCCWM